MSDTKVGIPKELRHRDKWMPIETAPTNGLTVRLRRVHEGELVTEGKGYWGRLAGEAPQRHREPGNDLTPDSPPFPDCDEPRWCTEDGRYSFPTPTHWMDAA